MILIITIFNYFGLLHLSNAQSCITQLPANSRTILDSNTFHTTNMAGQAIAFAFPGWLRFDVDEIIYSGPDDLQWRPPTTGTGSCGPYYLSCFAGGGSPVNTTLEMNWLVTSYYETEANVIYIRVRCAPLSGTGFATDCRDAFQIFYYQSDQDITINSSLLSQFLPVDSDKTVDRVVSAEFNQSNNGFFIGLFNNIPCVELIEIEFYYFECPATNTSDLYSLPAVPVPNPTDVFVRVNISCPAGSLHRDPLRLLADCYYNGTWILPTESVCECEAGYYLSVSNANSSMPCVVCGVDTYKGETGNSEACSVCPFRSNTRGIERSSECLCDEDWYRGEGESVSESCGQSPSAVVDLRVERGDSVIVSRVVWDEPSYLGNRSENELRYNVSYYPSLTPSREESVGELRETELVLSSGDVANSTEYVFVVTSWNSVSSVSGVFNSANVTVLSSFPTLVNISYNETSGYLQWSYELYGRRDYVFEISYATNISLSSISFQTVSHSMYANECICSTDGTCTCIVSVPNLNPMQYILFRLLVNDSGNFVTTNLQVASVIIFPPTTLLTTASISTASFPTTPTTLTNCSNIISDDSLLKILQGLIGFSFGLFILFNTIGFLSLLIWIHSRWQRNQES